MNWDKLFRWWSKIVGIVMILLGIEKAIYEFRFAEINQSATALFIFTLVTYLIVAIPLLYYGLRKNKH